MNPRETESYTTICFVLYYYIKTKYTAKETVVHTVEKKTILKIFSTNSFQHKSGLYKESSNMMGYSVDLVLLL